MNQKHNDNQFYFIGQVYIAEKFLLYFISESEVIQQRLAVLIIGLYSFIHPYGIKFGLNPLKKDRIEFRNALFQIFLTASW